MAKFELAKESPSRGMLLGDEPGLGKTLAALGIILNNKDVTGSFALMVAPSSCLKQLARMVDGILIPVCCNISRGANNLTLTIL